MTEILQTLFGDFYGNMLSLMLSATRWTIYLSITAFIGGGIIGLLFTVLRIAPNRTLNQVATIYIWMFQAIPLLMLLFIIGLGVPVFFKIDVPAWLAATISLTLFTSAFMSEVWRGALDSVPPSQWEAGKTLGLSFSKTLRLIIAPQALRIATPPTVGFMVQVIKGTSLAYIIDYHDLMRWGKKIANSQLEGAEPFVVYPIMAVIYFSLCFPISKISKRLERSMINHKGMPPRLPLNEGV